MLSLIHRLNLSLSCSTISLASQFIIWLFWQTWSVMADLWCSLVEALRVDLVKFLSEIFSASFLCSVILVPSCLPVSPMYTFSHWLHGIFDTTPAFFCLSTLSFRWTKTLGWWTGTREPVSFLQYGHKWSPLPNQGRGRLQSDLACLSQWLTPSEAYLRLLTPLTISKFWQRWLTVIETVSIIKTLRLWLCFENI